MSDELKRSLSLSGDPDGGMVYDYYLRAMMPWGVSIEMRLREVYSDVSFVSVLNKSPGLDCMSLTLNGEWGFEDELPNILPSARNEMRNQEAL